MKNFLAVILGTALLFCIVGLVFSLVHKFKSVDNSTEMHLDSGILVQKEIPIRPIVCTVNLLSPTGDTLTWLSYDKPSSYSQGTSIFYDTSGVKIICNYSWVTIKSKE